MNTIKCAWQAYRTEPIGTRFHIGGRAVICPFPKIMPYFPPSGKILDIGCGHGLLLQLLSADPSNKSRALFGMDHAAEKIDIARRHSKPDMEFSTGSLDSFPDSSFDAVSIVDVLYTVDLNKWDEIFRGCLRVLKPGGSLILKEVVDTPRWKCLAIMVEEKLAVEILKITKGEKPHIENAGTYRHVLETSGFRIAEARPLSHWSWISHYLFVAHKPK